MNMDDKIFVARPSLPDKEEYFAEIAEIWETHILTNMGPKHKKFEELLKSYLGVERLSLFSHGHMALELVLQAMHLHGEVITTPFTFVSTTHAIVRNGLKPVFCDIDPLDYTIDTKKLESLITENTTAIIPVHVYGTICNYKEIDRIAKKYNLQVIYDAAHAFGESVDGIKIGNLGDASMLSFHATKVFHTIEGGTVCYRDDMIGKRLYQLKNFGFKSELEVNGIGANAKMNELQAAMGICNLRHIDDEITKRRKAALRYQENLKDMEGIYLPPKQEQTVSNYAYFPIRVEKEQFGKTRDDINMALRDRNIYPRRYFYPLTSQFECYRDSYDAKETPIALDISKKILTLPMYADLSAEEIDLICEIIGNIK